MDSCVLLDDGKRESASESSEDDAYGNEIRWKDINTAEIQVNGDFFSDGRKQVHTNYFSEEARTGFNLFRVLHVYIRRVPNDLIKYHMIRTMEHGCRSHLLTLFETVVKRMAQVLHPSDRRGISSAYCAQKSSEGRLARQMVSLLRKLKKGSVQKRVVRACLFASLQGHVLYELMTEETRGMELEIDDICTGKDGEMDSDDEETSADAGNQIERNNRRRSTGNRDSTELQETNQSELREQDGMEMRTGGETTAVLLNRKNLSGGLQRLQKTSRTDWLTQVTAGALQTDTKRRRHF